MKANGTMSNRPRAARWASVLMAATAVVAASAFADTSITPGKQAIYVSNSNVSMPFLFDAQILSGQILKGKKKMVLEITFGWTVHNNSATNQSTGARAKVNGYDVEPKSALTNDGLHAGQDCPPSSGCTTTSHAFLDIDAAEAAHPGSFVGQPLNVDLVAFAGSVGVSAEALLEAHLQKK
jgi:hypothetical protein